MSINVWFTTLTEHLIDELKNTGQMTLLDAPRHQVICGLEHILSSPSRLLMHIKLLFRLSEPEKPVIDKIATDEVARIAVSGFEPRPSDDDLIMLIISPMQLLELSYMIDEHKSKYWVDVFHRESHHAHHKQHEESKTKRPKFCL